MTNSMCQISQASRSSPASYQLVEETTGALQIEGLDHYVGRDSGAGLRRGVALAPTLARHATDRQAAETQILKERRKAREEKASEKSSNGKSGGKGGAPKTAAKP